MNVFFSLFNKSKKPNTFFYNSFIQDAWIYIINKKSLFHFLSNIKIQSKENGII